MIETNRRQFIGQLSGILIAGVVPKIIIPKYTTFSRPKLKLVKGVIYTFQKNAGGISSTINYIQTIDRVNFDLKSLRSNQLFIPFNTSWSKTLDLVMNYSDEL